MSNEVVIRAEGLGKKYLIGHKAGRETYTTLRDTLARNAKAVLRSASDLAKGRAMIVGDEIEEFWALRDLGFEVNKGDVVGILGRNGAGKSTLLKILSRITDPTEGRVEIKGRVASLLEVGTGFHPELTGRENIFLNGAIMGMSRAETKQKFDDIVAFAGVARFLDTPVKRYSSGMYVRLAFAVAAHLEPDILIIDEVLAVGDAEFQKKCLGKMSDVAAGGRTVVFVSHNVNAVSALCNKAILLKQGRVQEMGPTPGIISSYLKQANASERVEFNSNPSRPSIDSVTVRRAALSNGDLVVEIGFSSPFPLFPIVVGITVTSSAGFPVWGSNSRFHPSAKLTTAHSDGVLSCVAKQIPLISDDYTVSVWLGDSGENYDHKPDAIRFSVPALDEATLRPPPEINGNLDWHGDWSISDSSTTASHDSGGSRHAP